MVVLDEGVVRVYSLLTPCPANAASASASAAGDGPSSNNISGPFPATASTHYIQLSLGADAAETGVVEGKVWDRGVVALTGAGRFVDLRIPTSTPRDDDGLWENNYATRLGPSILPAPTAAIGGETTAGPLIPTAWTFIPPVDDFPDLVQVLLSPPAPIFDAKPVIKTDRDSPAPIAAGGTVVSIDTIKGPTDMRLNRGPFSSILASPNGKLLSLLTADKTLWVVSSDFQRSLSEFSVVDCDAYREALARSPTPDLGGLGNTGIRQIQWCGNNTVALAWENEVVMVGPFGESLRYYYSSPVHLISEIDGVRIIGSQKMELIQKVAESTSTVFRPGSSEPAALLYDASENFAHRSAKADEGLRAIRNELPAAVDVCIDAAAQEWDPVWQKRLLRAADLGKSFLDSRYDPSNFVETSKKLRVLNNLRAYDVGVPVSVEQYDHVGARAMITRLVNRNHHLLALRISAALHLQPGNILRHWARAKIGLASVGAAAALPPAAKAKQDDALCNEIVDKFISLGPSVAVSYSSIAMSAFRAGRVRLATLLLDHEPRAVDQIPLLLKMGEDKVALQKSVESGDTDLVYHVLLKLQKQLSRGDFFRVVQSPAIELSQQARCGRPTTTAYQQLALRLLELYAYQFDRELLKDLYFTDDRRVELASLALQDARAAQSAYIARSDDADLSTTSLKLKEASKLFNEDRERSLESKLVDEQARLLAFQTVLEKEDGRRSTWTGLSLNDTIRECLVKSKNSTHMAKKAEKLKTDFKVNDKRWTLLKVDAFLKTRDWDALWNFANTKRPPPGGFEPIIVRLLQVKADNEALRYVPKIMAVGEKADRARFK